MAKVVTAALTALLWLTACGMRESYRMQVPATWLGEIAEDDDENCRALSGEYEYYGEDSDASAVDRIRADFYVTAFKRVPVHGARSVKVSYDADASAFYVWTDQAMGVHGADQISGTCENGWAIVEGVVSGQGTDAPPQVKQWRSRLKRGTDGALYVHWTFNMTKKCYLLLADCHESGEGWTRFAPSAK
jgi:hypothetical protein